MVANVVTSAMTTNHGGGPKAYNLLGLQANVLLASEFSKKPKSQKKKVGEGWGIVLI